MINVITRKPAALAGGHVSSTLATFIRVTSARATARRSRALLDATGRVAYSSDGERRIYFDEFNDPLTNTASPITPIRIPLPTCSAASRAGRDPASSLRHARQDDPTARSTRSQRSAESHDRAPRLSRPSVRRHGRCEVAVGSRVYFDHYAYDGDYVFDYSSADAPQLVVNRDFARATGGAPSSRAAQAGAAPHAHHRHRVSGQLPPTSTTTTTALRAVSDDHRQSYNWGAVRAGRDGAARSADSQCRTAARSLRHFGGTTTRASG